MFNGLLRAVGLLCGFLFADHSVAVSVPHVLVCRVSAVDWRDAVGPCLGAGDSAVAVVVVEVQGGSVSGGAGSGIPLWAALEPSCPFR